MDSNNDETLDHFITGPPSDFSLPPASTTEIVDSLNEHLSYPSLDTEDDSSHQESSSQSQAPALFKDRIYVGNLHPSVDEYTLVQVFSKFGKITSVDYLFHKSGPLKGKPRGYAFVKYSDEGDAQKAMSMAHDKLLRGRKIVVTYAHHAPLDSAGGASGRNRRAMMEIGRPTTLSLLKSGPSSRPLGTAAKIAKMEAKLRQLESPTVTTPQSLHPSLPPKPQTGSVELQSKPLQRGPKSTSASSSAQQDKHPPSLLKLQTPSALTSPPLSSSAISKPSNKPKAKLLGVKIKPKDKDKPKVAATPASQLDS